MLRAVVLDASQIVGMGTMYLDLRVDAAASFFGDRQPGDLLAVHSVTCNAKFSICRRITITECSLRLIGRMRCMCALSLAGARPIRLMDFWRTREKRGFCMVR